MTYPEALQLLAQARLDEAENRQEAEHAAFVHEAVAAAAADVEVAETSICVEEDQEALEPVMGCEIEREVFRDFEF